MRTMPQVIDGMARPAYLDFAGLGARFALGLILPNARSIAHGASSAPTSAAIATKAACCWSGVMRFVIFALATIQFSFFTEEHQHFTDVVPWTVNDLTPNE